jgi:hypothetical protein
VKANVLEGPVESKVEKGVLAEAFSVRAAGRYLALPSAHQMRAQQLVAHSARLGRVDRQIRKQCNLRPANSSNKTNALWNNSGRKFSGLSSRRKCSDTGRVPDTT